MRIVIEGTSVGVYGPGTLVSHRTFGEEMDATLHQADVEQALVMDGWTLERLTMARRSADRDVSSARRPERSSTLRIVPESDDSTS